jgi:Sporulation related domain.
MSVISAISDLLYIRETVVVPGLGAFVCKNTSAKTNVITNHFEPPFRQIEFDAHLREENDVLANHISECDDVTYDEAKNEILKFVSDCFQSLKNGQKVELPKIGKLSFDAGSEIWFEQDVSLNYNADAFGLADFYPEPVFRVDTRAKLKTEIEQQQKDKNTPMAVAKPQEKEARQIQLEDESPSGKREAKPVDETAQLAVEESSETQEDKLKPHHGWIWIALIMAGLVIALAWLYRTKSHNINFVREKSLPEETIALAEQSVDTVLPDTISSIMLSVIDSLSTTDTVNEPLVANEPAMSNSGQETSTDTLAQANVDQKYVIIGGCFSIRQNADELVSALRTKGYADAYVTGQNRSGLWMVSYGRYKSYQEAARVLQKIKANNNSAWISKL